MKLVVFGGFVFLGGCILFGAYSISYVIGGNTPAYTSSFGGVLMGIGAVISVIGIVIQHINDDKDK